MRFRSDICGVKWSAYRSSLQPTNLVAEGNAQEFEGRLVIRIACPHCILLQNCIIFQSSQTGVCHQGKQHRARMHFRRWKEAPILGRREEHQDAHPTRKSLDNLIFSHNECILDLILNSSCERCRKQKIRCSGRLPCDACTKRDLACHFNENHRRVVVTRGYVEIRKGAFRNICGCQLPH